MKSLDIVNANLEYMENENKVVSELDDFAFKTIKQDLEVLVILKKYLYIVENQIPRTDDYFEMLESDLDEMQDDENCDDFKKVKQWLEKVSEENDK